MEDGRAGMVDAVVGRTLVLVCLAAAFVDALLRHVSSRLSWMGERVRRNTVNVRLIQAQCAVADRGEYFAGGSEYSGSRHATSQNRGPVSACIPRSCCALYYYTINHIIVQLVLQHTARDQTQGSFFWDRHVACDMPPARLSHHLLHAESMWPLRHGKGGSPACAGNEAV